MGEEEMWTSPSTPRFRNVETSVKIVGFHITTQQIAQNILRIQDVIKKFQDSVSENYNLLLMAKNI
jgi:hypothetical protein